MKHWPRTILITSLGAILMVGSHAMADDRFVRDARQYLEKGELNAAVIQLKNALQRDPNNAQARLLLGKSHLDMGDGASAEKELERARELGVEADVVLPLLGKAWLLMNRPERVLETIDAGGHQGDALADRLYLRGQAFVLQKQLDQAEAM